MAGQQIDVLQAKNIRIGVNDSNLASNITPFIITQRGSGDANMTFEVGDGTTRACIGIDNSNSDSLSFSSSGGLNTTSAIIIDSSSRAGFSANPNSSAQVSVTPTATRASLFLANSLTTATPSGGGYLLVSGGELHFVASTGKTTQLTS